MRIMKKPELMAPAGDWTMLNAAIQNGADAVYFGVDKLNMRAKAKNFTMDELSQIVSHCKEHKVKTYLTINTIVFEEELNDLNDILLKAKQAGVDMIICWDLAVLQKCKEYNLPVCISTQASISNSAAAQFYKEVGAARIVLARECSLQQIKEIRKKTDLEIEAFVHGAMCIAVSGRCFMSHHLFGKSANRGECIQPCRREYEIIDHQIDNSLVLGEDYVMSPKDLCSIEYIDQLIEAGIDSFKIEGRKRSPEYVAKVISVYRMAIDKYYDGGLPTEYKSELLEELRKVYNRGFSSGFYFDVPSSEEFTHFGGSIATTRKVYLGKVINYYKNPQIAWVRLQTGSIKADEDLLIIGTTTGVVEVKVSSLMKDDVPAAEGVKGDDVTFYCKDLVRPGDMVYKVVAVGEVKKF